MKSLLLPEIIYSFFELGRIRARPNMTELRCLGDMTRGEGSLWATHECHNFKFYKVKWDLQRHQNLLLTKSFSKIGERQPSIVFSTNLKPNSRWVAHQANWNQCHSGSVDGFCRILRSRLTLRKALNWHLTLKTTTLNTFCASFREMSTCTVSTTWL